MKYLVAWEIDIETDDGPVDAAQQAMEIMQDPNSTATFFDVTDENGRLTTVELDEGEPTLCLGKRTSVCGSARR